MRFGDDVLRTDLYALLGVDPKATITDIRVSYRSLVRQSHPDLNPSDHGAGERTARLNLAARILLDPYLRASYDRLRIVESDPEHVSSPGTDTPAWYEARVDSANAEWAEPAVSRPPAHHAFETFLSDIRSFEGRVGHAISDWVDATPDRAKAPLLALCIAIGLLLIQIANPNSGHEPTTIAPAALNP